MPSCVIKSAAPPKFPSTQQQVKHIIIYLFCICILSCCWLDNMVQIIIETLILVFSNIDIDIYHNISMHAKSDIKSIVWLLCITWRTKAWHLPNKTSITLELYSFWIGSSIIKLENKFGFRLHNKSKSSWYDFIMTFDKQSYWIVAQLLSSMCQNCQR